jgi:hypothetical protein
MMHEVNHNGFHGTVSVRFRGPAEGFRLSPAQVARWHKALCGSQVCQCGGGYGTGFLPGRARIEWEECCDEARLIPAAEIARRIAEEEARFRAVEAEHAAYGREVLRRQLP